MRPFLLSAVALAPVLCAGHASAHAFLKTASPPVGGTIQQPPSQVEIVFTEGVEPSFSTIQVTAASGDRVDTGAAHLDGEDTHLAVALKPLAPGAYSVVWHALSTDTHKTEGRFTFTLKP